MTNGRGFIGTKYAETKDLDIAQVAKLVRADLKVAQAKGEIPAGKTSVRISRYAGGSSMNLTLKMANPPEWGTNEQRELDRKLEAIMDAYIYDDSDSMTDYFHVRFYTFARVEKA